MSMSEARKPITLMIIDDQPLLRAGIAAMVSGYADIELVGEASCGPCAMALFRDVQPDVTLMTVQTPAINSIEAIQTIVTEFPQARIAMLGGSGDNARVMQAIGAGAHAYVPINHSHRELADSVRTLAAGRQYRPASIEVDRPTDASADRLTRREWQVLHWVAQGRSNREVAQLLTISETTVKGHLHNTMRKLGARNRTHAVTLGLQRGIIKVER